MRYWKIALSVGMISLFPLIFSSPALAQAKKGKKGKREAKEMEAEKGKYDLEGLAILGKDIKESPGFYEMSYVVQEGRKKVKKSAWLKVDSSTTLFRDVAVPVSAFQEGEELKIFTKPLETDQGGRGGYGGKFRVMRATRVMIGGKEVRVNEAFADPKDEEFIWCNVTVEKSGAAMTVLWESSSYKLSMDKRPAVLKRLEGDLKRDFRRNARLVVRANKTDVKPADQKKELDSFQAVQVFILEPKALNWYGAIFPFLNK